MSKLISKLVMKSHQGELLILLEPDSLADWKLKIFDKDNADEWQWTAGGNGQHDHLLRVGMKYAWDRLGPQMEPIEIT
jgi:hypothetical protein